MPQKLADFWQKFRAGYAEGVLVNFFLLFTVFAYFAPSGVIPAAMFIAGLCSLGYLSLKKGAAIHSFWPVAGLTLTILLFAFVRSDFVDLLLAGKSLGDAYWTSTRYFQAPLISWFTTWAFVFVAWRLSEARSQRVTVLVSWIVIGLVAVQLLDCLGNLALRNGMNQRFFGNARPEMLIVESSNLNLVLLMLFWPLAFFAVERRWLAGVGAAVAAIALGGFVVDSNAHIVVLAVSAVAFFAARYWPAGLTRKAVLPERVAAVVAAVVVLGFPLLIQWLVKTGLATQIHDRVPRSWAHRIEIWTYAVERALEKPIWGWGFEAARYFEPIIPLHPHNPSLQAWLELGIPGLLLVAALWFSIFWFLAPKGDLSAGASRDGLVEITAISADSVATSVEQSGRPYMLAAATAYFTLNVLSYGLWKAWLISLAAMMLVVAILVIKAVKQDRSLPLQL
jgi:O-antigen ligase